MRRIVALVGSHTIFPRDGFFVLFLFMAYYYSSTTGSTRVYYYAKVVCTALQRDSNRQRQEHSDREEYRHQITLDYR